MTVIAINKTTEAINIAADSLISRGSQKVSASRIDVGKIFQGNDLVIASSGAWHEAALLEIFIRTNKPESADLSCIMDFLWRFKIWAREKEENFPMDSCHIIVFKDKIFRTDGGLNINPVPQFDAIGAGQDFALAAMHLGKTPKEAVEVACELSVWCNAPITEIAIPIATNNNKAA